MNHRRSKVLGYGIRKASERDFVRLSDADAGGGHGQLVPRVHLLALVLHERHRARELASHVLHHLDVRDGRFFRGDRAEARFRDASGEKLERDFRGGRRGSTVADVSPRDPPAPAAHHPGVHAEVPEEDVLVPLEQGRRGAVLTHRLGLNSGFDIPQVSLAVRLRFSALTTRAGTHAGVVVHRGLRDAHHALTRGVHVRRGGIRGDLPEVFHSVKKFIPAAAQRAEVRLQREPQPREVGEGDLVTLPPAGELVIHQFVQHGSPTVVGAQRGVDERGPPARARRRIRFFTSGDSSVLLDASGYLLEFSGRQRGPTRALRYVLLPLRLRVLVQGIVS